MNFQKLGSCLRGLDPGNWSTQEKNSWMQLTGCLWWQNGWLSIKLYVSNAINRSRFFDNDSIVEAQLALTTKFIDTNKARFTPVAWWSFNCHKNGTAGNKSDFFRAAIAVNLTSVLAHGNTATLRKNAVRTSRRGQIYADKNQNFFLIYAFFLRNNCRVQFAVQ